MLQRTKLNVLWETCLKLTLNISETPRKHLNVTGKISGFCRQKWKIKFTEIRIWIFLSSSRDGIGFEIYKTLNKPIVTGFSPFFIKL